ncbi:MAG: hypothetical protein V3V60_15860 [Sphingomonas aquatilis]|uniref:hypothetical protein n=1 Tax=Sphingomonas aquatilis TaxID=93063 RepID=UPI002F2F0266
MSRPVLTVRKPQVSDHALIRFLQRAGMNVEAVRADLAASLATAHGAAQAMGGGDHLILADELMYVVRNAIVVTVLPAGNVHQRAQALCRRHEGRPAK